MYEPERSHGWTTFATIAIGIAGAWNLILGATALAKKDYFDEASMLYGNLAFWGWTWMIIGVMQVLTALLVARRTAVGKALGLVGAAASMIIWFLSIGARPVATIAVITLDVLVLYALTADRPSGAMAYGRYVEAHDGRTGPPLETGRHFG